MKYPQVVVKRSTRVFSVKRMSGFVNLMLSCVMCITHYLHTLIYQTRTSWKETTPKTCSQIPPQKRLFLMK